MIANLGFQTDFIFLDDGGVVEETDTYYVVQTRSNPTFRFGNYLLLKSAPKMSDRKILEANFELHFNDMPTIDHYTFCWEQPTPEGYQKFINNGYKYEQHSVLILNAKDALVPKQVIDLEIKTITDPSDWMNWIELETKERLPEDDEAGFREFINLAMEKYKRLSDKGLGDFYGAFLNDQLVASAGLYIQNGVARFQKVVTDRNHRRKGICTALIGHLCYTHTQQADSFVIVADNSYHALGLYKSLGFKIEQQQLSLCLAHRNKD